MVRPPVGDAASRRSAVVIGAGTTLGTAAEEPLMSDAIRWGDLLFLSGRAAVDTGTGRARGDGFEDQCQIVLADIAAVLEEAGTGPENVLRVECWLTRQSDFPAWNRAFIEAFPPPRPARTTLIGEMPLAGLLIELQVTAGIPS